MGRVVVVGSVNVDLVTSVERHPRPGETVRGSGLDRYAGGKGANQAMAAARAGGQLHEPVPTVMVARVGSDEGGGLSRERLSRAGVDVTHVGIDRDHRTGHALIVVDEEGENTIVAIPGANDQLAPGHLAALDDCGPGDVVLLQLEVPLSTVAWAAQRACERGARVILNTAPFAALPDDVIALADPLVANAHEAAALADAGGVPTSLLVTFGRHGANWDGIEYAAHPVPADRVRDTTGAGDAFCGALAAALAAGHDRDEAMGCALAAGAAAVLHHGAQPDPQLT